MSRIKIAKISPLPDIRIPLAAQVISGRLINAAQNKNMSQKIQPFFEKQLNN